MEIAPEALDAQVPKLILQPIVENAIRHGIDRRANGGAIEITAAVSGGTLALEVRDDGPGLGGAPEEALGRGVGLANTRERLRSLYGEGERLVLRSGPGGGLAVLVSTPFHTAPLPGA
jgi:sensor histidine kinase YesM